MFGFLMTTANALGVSTLHIVNCLTVSKMIYVIKTDFFKRFIRKAICSKGRKTWQGNGESKSEYGIMYVFTKDF